MEHLLNLLWLVIVLSLFAAVTRANATGKLRCSFALALGCTALLAIFLFPAVSMTDDLQRAKLDAATAGRSATLSALAHGTQQLPVQEVLLSILLLLTLFAARLIAAEVLSRASSDRGAALILRASRPSAVRPPPALLLA